ncbi:MAG: molybdopterin-guanine dinucleotide biosynthesis protein B [Deltaproteobacteria bacterium RBG_13_43_22]|jgi:molybdopterin-guanine dinucleotide biosynthesis protein B|nr:MAG: molybdopterin-guanine dinucleotide biosynthesis protein B [Deltaproteobacteria bacterium RBG_13_43_22]
MPLIISIVGYSDSGKTRLLEKIIPLLKAKGYSAGVIKHSGHEFLLDQPGKDTHKLRQAGADGVVLLSSGQISFLGKIDEGGGSLLDRIEQSFFSDRDIILTEGFKKGDQPKIAVLTKGKEEKLLQEIEGSIVATVGENPARADLTHFKPDNPGGLVRMLEDRFLKERKRIQIRVILDGKNIPMNHFVQEMVQSGIMGMLSPLKGFKDSRRIEVKILFPEKGAAK